MAPRHYVCELFVHLCVRACVGGSIGNERVPKVIHNKNFLLNCNQHFDNYFKPFLIKLLRVFYLKKKHVNILALEMASPGNPHCASCIGTLSVPVLRLACRRFLVVTENYNQCPCV